MLRLVGALDPNFGWANGRLSDASPFEWGAGFPAGLRGAYACAALGPSGARLARDPLGINKLFWASGADGGLLVAARPHHLVEAGCGFGDIRAIPPGACVDLDPAGTIASAVWLRPRSWPEESPCAGASLAALAEGIRHVLEDYCAALARAHEGAPVYVCLSGGLDSAGIAVVAREHFPGLRAVSFDLLQDDRPPSEDRRAAERLAADLGLPLIPVTVTVEEILDLLDTVLVEGVDWRDFNVHAGLVNAALARAISRLGPSGRTPLALSGDLANEFLADYHPERCGQRTYYALPRLSPAQLRAALVRGLETSHREVGPFLAWGVRVVQPYAVAVDSYMALPDEFLQLPDCKERLCRLVFGDAVPDYVYRRPKTRAQVGGGDGGGVLGLCVGRGIDGPWLRGRFAALHGVADPTRLRRFICGGRYRAAFPGVGGEA